eukprot:gb/GECH01009484.1/.p1 GENE.gb/GECH01009484.1/~~gb/GECH01009484.1/.p1  ORF type:complete len:122 (+),score=7.27 gb/GECH01009484.1/:1-366(+)
MYSEIGVHVPLYIYNTQRKSLRLGLECDCFDLSWFDKNTIVLKIGEIKSSSTLKKAKAQLESRIEFIIKLLCHFKNEIQWKGLLAKGIVYVPNPLPDGNIEYLDPRYVGGIPYTIEIRRVQ